jgi:hypothetical protein
MADASEFAASLASSQSPADLRRALQEMLLQRLSQDASLAGVAPLLLSRLAPPSGPREPAAADADTDPPEPMELSPAVRGLNEAVAAAATEERRLRGLLAELAVALGACTSCLGSEPACTACSGLGGPGFAQPNEEAFACWVEPAMAGRRHDEVTSGEMPHDVVSPTPQGGRT